MRKIEFVFGSVTLEAELLPTPTADAIWKRLPIDAQCVAVGGGGLF